MPGTFVVDEHTYQCTKMTAMDQFHVARRLTPILKSFEGVLRNIGDSAAAGAPTAPGVKKSFATLLAGVEPFLQALHDLSDADAEYIINKCLRVAQRKDDSGTGWASVVGGQSNRLMFEDINAVAMITITAHVLKDQLATFIPDLPSK